MKSFYVFLLSFFVALPVWAQIEHPALGTKVSTADSTFTITLISRKQNYSYLESATLDKDIRSPKSVNIHPNGTKYYVNSLEGARRWSTNRVPTPN